MKLKIPIKELKIMSDYNSIIDSIIENEKIYCIKQYIVCKQGTVWSTELQKAVNS